MTHYIYLVNEVEFECDTPFGKFEEAVNFAKAVHGEVWRATIVDDKVDWWFLVKGFFVPQKAIQHTAPTVW